MNLDKIIDRTRFDGIIAISDVHAVHHSLKLAIDYAAANRLFMVFLGDLIDGGREPYETVREVHAVLAAHNGALVVGNHDYKFYRYAIGRKVVLKHDHRLTLLYSGKNRSEFLNTIEDLVDHDHSDFVLRLGRWLFVHGAAHRDLWTNPESLKSKHREKALYGEVTGERDENDFPIRTYSWINDIPSGHSVVVGHDRKPFRRTLSVTGPTTVRTANGGTVFFTDTGSGKTVHGYLTGTVLSFAGDDLQFDRFVKF